ncbi:MAG: hypothetical protein ACE5DI_04955 [Candidatus Micrarchaeia archaeon]
MALIEFYGAECPHCLAMKPRVEQLEKEEGVTIEQFEVWHNAENQEKMRSYAEVLAPACGGDLGVPAFINTDTKDALCGEVTYETLKTWAKK